ncbi:MAG: hypothetical protein ACXWP5_08515, partial [Bdellovibrionota bacterium]
KLMAQHREMTLDAARTAGDVSVQIDPNLRSGVRVSQAVPSAALAPPRRTPAAITPQILGPVHKAKFVASKKQPLPVAIRWSPLPEGLKPEVELTRFDDPEFRTPLTVTTLGASVDLPLGAYSFRVRTSNDDGKTSEWSPRYEFSLHEHIDPKAAVSALTVKRADSPEAIEAAERMRKVVQSQEEARQRREAIAAEESKRKQDFVRQQTELRERARVQREILAKKQAVLRAAEEVARKEEIRRRENLRNTRYLAVIQAAQERTAVLAPAPSLSFSIRQKISEATPSAGAPEAPTPTLGSQRSPAASTELKDLSRLDRLNISLDWNPIQGAKEYHLEVFRGGDRFKNEKLSRNHYDLELNELDPSKKITYEISTTLPNGREIRSGITPVAVQVSSPRPVEPPSEAMANLRTPVLFSWAKTVLTDKYDFQLSSDATFSQLLENKELDANYATLKITQPGVYFWRVRGKSRRFTSDWSAPSRLYLRTN